MDINRFTEKSREALTTAQGLAAQYGHQEVDAEHLALALVNQEDGFVPRVLERVGVAPKALVTALESGVRSGTRSRTGIRLQYLVEELADRPDVRFIAVTMPDGTILAHSNPARVGEVLNTRGGRELGAETIAALRPSETPSWAIIDMEGSRAFVVFKTFHPKIKGEGRQDEPTVGPLPYVFLGLDLAPLEVAQAQNRERAVLLGAGVLLAGMLALLGLHAVERVRSSRRGQRVAEALAEELAVALPDGLVVFDAKGRITRMNKAALTLLGMEAPAKGKAFLGRKPAEVLPSALAELAAKLLQEPVLPDTEYSDYALKFAEDQDELHFIHIDMNTGTGLPDKVYTMMLTDHKYQLRKDLFDLDALVFDGGQIRQAGIVMPDGSDYLTLLCDGFPNFGIWAAPGAPFVCLEPWCGRCDNFGYEGELQDKPGINSLNVDETFKKVYSIVIGG